ncbi:MAG: transcriptional regulator [Acidobacteria bacterium]|nr:MAG: transcriptional regulator [Acidobacteriota bacterium]PYY22996.1 MAG: transcriptional regulator [Acidobacteriota bacterium]
MRATSTKPYWFPSCIETHTPRLYHPLDVESLFAVNTKLIPVERTSGSARRQGVPLLDLSRQYATLRKEVLAAVEAVCDSQHYILGPAVSDFETRAAKFLGANFCIGCASGTDAIFLALAAAGIGPGDEVVTTPFSFFATASSITRIGARPVFADIDPNTYNLDPHSVQSLLDHHVRVKAILPVHLYGQCADMDALANIAEQSGLVLVEDAAQAFGATWRGRRAGTLGQLACFSFYPTKNLNAFGDAGAVTTNDEDLAARVRLLRAHGSRQRYYHEEIGWNSRLDSVQAAVLSVKLKYLEKWNRQRQQHAETYAKLFRKAGLGHPDSPVRLPETDPNTSHIYHQYVIRAQRRDELRRFLTDREIGSEVFYPVPLHRQKAFDYLGYGEGSVPIAEAAAREVLALPMFAELRDDELRIVVDAIAEFYS